MPSVKVMGIVNVTPDSFSDGGMFFRPEEAVRRALNLVEDGADIIDLGGESTRPGAESIGWREEWSRIDPVLRTLAGKTPVMISIDTYHPETAALALSAGAGMINCVKLESAAAMMELTSAGMNRRDGAGIQLVLPAKILDDQLLRSRLFSLQTTCFLDPMIGFGTTREEDIALLKSIPSLAGKWRVLVGASRKRIVKKLTGEKMPGKDIAGNVAVALWAAAHGASAVRVHDVRETVQALKVFSVLDSGGD